MACEEGEGGKEVRKVREGSEEGEGGREGGREGIMTSSNSFAPKQLTYLHLHRAG